MCLFIAKYINRELIVLILFVCAKMCNLLELNPDLDMLLGLGDVY